MTSLVSAATVLPIIVTKMVDTYRNLLDPENKVYKVWWNFAALGTGVGLALLFRLHGVGSIPSISVQGVPGELLTGLVIGGASSGYHELFDALSGIAKNAQASADQKTSGGS